MTVAALDFGGTTVKAGLVRADGSVTDAWTLPAPVDRAGLDPIADRVRQWGATERLLGVGVAVPGVVDASGSALVGVHGKSGAIAGVDLRGTEVVVLSACETGLGVAAYGDEFAGLRRAFTIAGAQSQVISLWAVDDDAAAALMGEYYDRLVAGQGRAEALAKAQQAVRDRPRFAHPNVWAAFAAWGQAGPLSNVLRQSASVPR